ncbi:MAG: hypothetical protein Q8R53_01785 [Nanoarchaeota archaeon]|nr:hypothetical protein [Nanoarchaeota archaeon]
MAKDKISSTEKKLGREVKKINRYADRATDILSQLSQSADELKLPSDLNIEDWFKELKKLKKKSKKLKPLVKKIGAYLSLISESLPYRIQAREESEAFKAEPLKLARELDKSVNRITDLVEKNERARSYASTESLVNVIDEVTKLFKQTTKWSYGALARYRGEKQKAKAFSERLALERKARKERSR